MSTNDNIEDELYSDVFYENALLSINTVIKHFETTPDAFANFSVADLKSIRLVTEGGMIQVLNPNYIPSKYSHNFNKCNFKTKHIINPFAGVVVNYEAYSECEISLTEEGLLKTVRFSEDVKTEKQMKLFWIIYNNRFEIENILTSCLKFVNGSFKDIEIKTKSYCESIESDSYFLNFFLKDAETKLLDILPEYTVPSAYDFTTDEFSIRLKVAEMLLI
jgi:hypothetical protein